MSGDQSTTVTRKRLCLECAPKDVQKLVKQHEKDVSHLECIDILHPSSTEMPPNLVLEVRRLETSIIANLEELISSVNTYEIDALRVYLDREVLRLRAERLLGAEETEIDFDYEDSMRLLREMKRIAVQAQKTRTLKTGRKVSKLYQSEYSY